jgi:hypothetical protein
METLITNPLFIQLPLEIFMIITKDIGQKLGSNVCKTWQNNFNIIFSNGPIFKTYINNYNIIEFCERTNIRVIHNTKCFNLCIEKIIEAYNNNTTILDNLSYSKCYYIIFKHFMSNIDDIWMQEYSEKIVDNFGELKDSLLIMCLDDEFYDGANFLIAHGADAEKYIMRKLNSEETKIRIINQLEYLVERHAINLGYICWHIYKNRKTEKKQPIKPGNYRKDILDIIIDKLPREILNNIVWIKRSWHTIEAPSYYDNNYTYDGVNPSIDEIIKGSSSCGTLLWNFSNPDTKISVIDVFNTFKVYFRDNIIDINNFYLGFNKGRIKYMGNSGREIEFESLIKTLIHKDILVYL